MPRRSGKGSRVRLGWYDSSTTYVRWACAYTAPRDTKETKRRWCSLNTNNTPAISPQRVFPPRNSPSLPISLSVELRFFFSVRMYGTCSRYTCMIHVLTLAIGSACISLHAHDGSSVLTQRCKLSLLMRWRRYPISFLLATAALLKSRHPGCACLTLCPTPPTGVGWSLL